MDHMIKDIYHPADTRETLPLPIPLRYFEAEPSWRIDWPVFTVRDADERLHNEDDVAVRFDDFATEYWRHGRAHRDGGLPAIFIQETTATELILGSGVRADSPDFLCLLPNTEICCFDGLIHSVKNAALVNHGDSDTFRMEYWCRGRRHCADGVAVETAHEKLWYYHGLLHRADGPACTQTTRRSVRSTCYWYGRKLSFDAMLDDDFPADEPPPLLVLHALSNSESCPDFADGKVVNMIARTCKLMPELALLSSGVADSDWGGFKLRILEFLFDQEKYRARIEDTAPLPDGFSEEP